MSVRSPVGEDRADGACEHVAANIADVAIYANAMKPRWQVIRRAIEIGAPFDLLHEDVDVIAAHHCHSGRYLVAVTKRGIDGFQSRYHYLTAVFAWPIRHRCCGIRHPATVVVGQPTSGPLVLNIRSRQIRTSVVGVGYPRPN